MKGRQILGDTPPQYRRGTGRANGGGLLAVRGARLLTAQIVPSPPLRRTADGTDRAIVGALLAVGGREC